MSTPKSLPTWVVPGAQVVLYSVGSVGAPRSVKTWRVSQTRENRMAAIAALQAIEVDEEQS